MPGRIAGSADPDGKHGEQRGPHANQHHRAEARGLVVELPLDADQPADEHREQQPDDLVQADHPGVGFDHGLMPPYARYLMARVAKKVGMYSEMRSFSWGV